VYGTADRADAKPGPTKIQVVGTLGPASGAYAKYVLRVNRLDFAHRAIAAAAGRQTGVIMLTLAGLFQNGCRNLEHLLVSPANCTEL
jgi:hypothetical protein